MSIENNRKPFQSQQEAHNYLRSLPTPRPYIHPTAIIENTHLGNDVTIGAYSVIGKEGFGFDPASGFSKRWPHLGKVIIGDNVEIGANTCIDRGTLGFTVIGDNTKIDNLVHVGHNARIGKGCVIVAGSIIGGSCVLGDGVFVGQNATIKDHISIGNNVIVGSAANVVKDVSDYVVVVGNPAKTLKAVEY